MHSISCLTSQKTLSDPAIATASPAYAPNAVPHLTYNPFSCLVKGFDVLQASSAAQIYGKNNLFDADRLIDLLGAFETFRSASTSAAGSSGAEFTLPTGPTASSQTAAAERQQSSRTASTSAPAGPAPFALPFPFPLPQFPPLLFPQPRQPASVSAFASSSRPSSGPSRTQPGLGLTAAMSDPDRGTAKATPGSAAHGHQAGTAREALKFVLSPEGSFFRDFLMTELVVSIDGLSRLQLASLVERLNLQVRGGYVAP